MMKVKCPSCGEVHEAPDHYQGKKVKCPKCNKSFMANDHEQVKAADQAKRDEEHRQQIKENVRKHKEVKEASKVTAVSSGLNTFLRVVGGLFFILGMLSCALANGSAMEVVAHLIACLCAITFGGFLLLISVISGWLRSVAKEVRITKCNSE